MTKKEYGILFNLNTKEDWMDHFRQNILTGIGPVSMYSCLRCDEIVDSDKLAEHKCHKG